jgi:hypothetical protein
MAHFYDENGESRHEVIGKTTGKPRPSTIKDAKNNGWYPSVTTILDILAKKSLEDWKCNQVALAARRLLADGKKVHFNTEEKSYLGIVKEEAFKQVDDAADLGTKVHEALEKGLQGKDYDKTYDIYVQPTKALLQTLGINILRHELRLVNKEFGYAGTTDAAFMIGDGDVLGILDFKTCKTKKDVSIEPIDSWPAQIAAYYVTYWEQIPTKSTPAKGLNIAISTTEPGRVEAIWYSGEQLETEWKMFYHLNEIYKLKTGHDPRNFTATKA